MSIQSIVQKLDSISQNSHEHFKKLDNWLNTYLDFISLENKNCEKKLPNIRRGQILYVNFGYNILSEFRYKHYCVALNNSPKNNPKVTVVPITSKHHPHQLSISYELADNLETIIRDKERSNFWKPFRMIYPELQTRGFTAISPSIGSYDTILPNCTNFIKHAMTYLSDEDIELRNTLNQILISLNKFDAFYKSSPKLLQSSFLKVEDITTISKARIISPQYKSHPLYQLMLSASTLDRLDQEIISRFTKPN
jgi:pemK-like protein